MKKNKLTELKKKDRKLFSLVKFPVKHTSRYEICSLNTEINADTWCKFTFYMLIANTDYTDPRRSDSVVSATTSRTTTHSTNTDNNRWEHSTTATTTTAATNPESSSR